MSKVDPQIVSWIGWGLVRLAAMQEVTLSHEAVMPWARRIGQSNHEKDAEGVTLARDDFDKAHGLSKEFRLSLAKNMISLLEDPAAPQPMLKLPPEYDGALLGHTLDPLGPPRHVYSLNRLARIHGRRHNLVSFEDAAESVWNYIRDIAKEHGGRMPVFVEDSDAENRPKIYTGG